MRKLLYFVIISIIIFSACERFSSRPDEFAYDSTQYERVSINYEIRGDQDTCLVLIHGWNLNLRYWDQQVKHFSSRYRILTIDLAGHGNSSRDRTNWSTESFARDIVTILDKESIEKAILVGHGLGGDVALEIAHQSPDRVAGLIGVDCFKNVDFEMTEDFRRDFRDHYNSFKSNYSVMADELARKFIRTKDRAVISMIVDDYRSADPKVALAIYKNMFPRTAAEKYNLQKVEVPLVLIGGDYEPYDTTALTRYTDGHYELLLIDGAGQFPMVEQPVEFNQQVERALSSVARSR